MNVLNDGVGRVLSLAFNWLNLWFSLLHVDTTTAVVVVVVVASAPGMSAGTVM